MVVQYDQMDISIDELESAQELHKNGSIAQGISGKRYKKVYFSTDMNEKTW